VSADVTLERHVLERIPDTAVLAGERGDLVWICPNVTHVFGYDPAQALALGSLEALLGSGFSGAVERAGPLPVLNLAWEVTDRAGDRHSLLVHAVEASIADATRLYLCRDVTALSWRERRLRSRANLLERVYDSLGEAVLVLEAGGEIVRDANPAAERVFGYHTHELRGRGFGRLFVDERDRAAVLDPMEGAPVEGSDPSPARRERRCRLRTRGDRVIDAEVTLSPMSSKDGLPGGAVAVVRDVSTQTRALEQIKTSRQRLRNLAVRLQAVREEERAMIAREVHDELGQALTKIKIDLVWLERRIGEAAEAPVRERIADMRELIGSTGQTVRDIASRLRPPVLYDLGLDAAVQWYVRDFEKRTDCVCTVSIELEGLEPDDERDTAVFRILQEALTNVARHARATRVSVSLRAGDERLAMEVRDDGRGVSESEVENVGSLGIVGMRERAGSLGGRVVIAPGPGGGTTVELSLPLA